MLKEHLDFKLSALLPEEGGKFLQVAIPAFDRQGKLLAPPYPSNQPDFVQDGVEYHRFLMGKVVEDPEDESFLAQIEDRQAEPWCGFPPPDPKLLPDHWRAAG